jgi:hypothetical protein
VTFLDHTCFRSCTALARVEFESGLQLEAISRFAFGSCPCLQSICLPPLFEIIDGSVFASIHIPKVSIDPANQNFELLDHFVVEIKSR